MLKLIQNHLQHIQTYKNLLNHIQHVQYCLIWPKNNYPRLWKSMAKAGIAKEKKETAKAEQANEKKGRKADNN